MEMAVSAPQKKKPPLALLLLTLLFGLPPLLGWLFFLNPQWLPDRHSNHGELIHPAQPVSTLKLSWANGQAVVDQDFSDAWRMVVVAEDVCSTDCRQQLELIHQIRRAIGGNQQRIKAMLILLPTATTGFSDRQELSDRLAAESTETVWLAEQSQTDLQALLALQSRNSADYSFVIDPMGALMMSHNHQQLDQKQILKDMEKLLKISQDWVKGTQYGHN